ncbi:MAG: permease-like cell division protein FtsX [Pseudomonadales bacterium]
MAKVARRDTKQKGAQQSHTGLGQKLKAWRASHKQECWASLRRLLRKPGDSLMTWMVIGIALALPAALYLALGSLEQLSSGWDGSARVSLYLNDTVSEEEGQQLAKNLLADGEIAAIEYISAADALVEFKSISGYGDVLDALAYNPLPAVIVVKPAQHLATAEQTDALVARLGKLDPVDQAELDLEWVQRLYAMMDLGRRAIAALALMLALGVLLVMGNTIRLAIENRRDEIVVTKLVGATDAFVRRPFLYTGWWYGLGGGLAAWIIVVVALLWLGGAVARLVGLYGGDFALLLPGPMQSLALLLGAGILGLLGAWLAVTRHLGAIEPR